MPTDPHSDAVTRPTLDTVADVRSWFEALTAAGVSFHCDESFAEIVEYGTGGKRTFTDGEAESMDRAMTRSFEVCDRAGEDAYDLGLAALRAALER